MSPLPNALPFWLSLALPPLGLIGMAYGGWTDVRTGGSCRFVFGHPAAEKPMAFFGRYVEVVPDQKLVWTNEEAEGGAVTTVAFTERDGRTEVVLRDVYPNKEVLDAAIESGSTGGYDEQFASLQEMLGSLEA